MRPWLTLAASLALPLAGCAQILGIEDTELGSLPAELACVGSVERPVGDGSPVEIVALIVNIATQQPIEGVRVEPCVTRLDINCQSGTTEFSDENGIVRVPVRSGFNGYLRILDPEDGTDDGSLVTYFWYFSEPIVETREDPFPIFAMTRGFRRAMLYADEEPPPDRGVIAINSTDCNDENLAGVRFEITTSASIDDDTTPFYFAGGFIQVMPDLLETDDIGIGGHIFVRPGTVGVRAIHAATGVTIAEDTLLVRPDVLTTVRLLPQ